MLDSAFRTARDAGSPMLGGMWQRSESQLIDALTGTARAAHRCRISLLRTIAELSARGTDVGNPAHVANLLAVHTNDSLYRSRNLVTFARELSEHACVYEAVAASGLQEARAKLILGFLTDHPPEMPRDALAPAEKSLVSYALDHSRADLVAMIAGLRDYYTEPPTGDDDDAAGSGDAAGTGDSGTRGHCADGAGEAGPEAADRATGSGAGGSACSPVGGQDVHCGHDDGTRPGDGEAGRGLPAPWALRRRPETFGGDDTTRNTLHVSRTLGGRYVIRGDVDAETGERLTAALSPLSAPRPEHDGARDRRSAARRRADGLSEYLRRHAMCTAHPGRETGEVVPGGGAPDGNRPASSGSAGSGPIGGPAAASRGMPAPGPASGTRSGNDFGGGAGTGAALSVHINLRSGVSDGLCKWSGLTPKGSSCDRARR